VPCGVLVVMLGLASWLGRRLKGVDIYTHPEIRYWHVFTTGNPAGMTSHVVEVLRALLACSFLGSWCRV
jgi:hypothetical protein